MHYDNEFHKVFHCNKCSMFYVISSDRYPHAKNWNIQLGNLLNFIH